MRAKLWMVAGAAAMWACGGATFVGNTDGGTEGGSGSGSGGSGGGSGSSGSGGGSGGTSGSSSGSSGGSSGGSSSGTGSGSSSGGTNPMCPSSAPSGGTSCPLVGMQCEYGDNANQNCNDIETCTSNGTWSYPTPGLPCPTGTCPGTYSQVPMGQACEPLGLDCGYAQGQCNCDIQPESAKMGPVWLCTTPEAGCPNPRPDIGTSCTESDLLACDYGGCTGGIELACTDGTWQEAPTACPAVAH